jgi:hypothetical protein
MDGNRATTTATATARRATRPRRSVGLDLGLLAVVMTSITVLFVLPSFLDDDQVSVGPDVPVYLWWTRVADAQGLSTVAARPGAPALIGAVTGTVASGDLLTGLAGLQYALGPALAVAGSALLRGRGSLPRPVWVAGGLLAGVWATHLGEGYLSNLAFAAPFLAAAAALARRRRRGTIAAATLLGGGGLLHPQFFVVGTIILLTSAGWAAVRERRLSIRSGDAGRVLTALAGGGVLVGAGLLAAHTGPAALPGDTSKDAYLRRIGHFEELRRLYRERFSSGWRKYAPIMNAILTIGGATRAVGYAQRFLVGWVVVTAIAVPLGLLTGRFPPDRMLTFAFCIPLLSAVGLLWLGRILRRRWLAYSVAVVLIVLTALPAIRGWRDTIEYVSQNEVRGATLAGRIAATTTSGTPLVFVAQDLGGDSVFLWSHVMNVARAAVPPDRAGDVVVFVGDVGDLLAGHSTVRGDEEFDLASAISFEELPDLAGAPIFVVSGFAKDPTAFLTEGLTRWDPTLATTVPHPRALPASPGELAMTDPGRIAGATIRALLLLIVVGFGWAWWAMGDVPGAAAIASAFGIAALTVSALVVERLGLGTMSAGPATIAVVLAGGSGYGLLVGDRLRRRARQRRRVA